jgi:carboxypeptidase Q
LKRRTPAVTLAVAIALALPFAANERIATDINLAIREEGLKNSQIMRTLHVLTDIHGPRLTGSPSLEAAGEWAVRQMESWGLANGRLEPWEWGRPGWTNEAASGAIVAPVRAPLQFEVLAWTPGTGRTVTAHAFNLIPPDQPTEADLTAYLESVRDDVRGAMVLVGRHRMVPVNLTAATPRRTSEQLAALFDPRPAPAAATGRRGAGPAARPSGPARLSPAQVSLRIDQFLVANRALVRINDAGRAHGQIAAFAHSTYDIERSVPTVILRNEDYGRISRILAHGTPVELEFTIVNRTHPEGRTAYNAVAELPGTDLRDEIVMIGAHLDSWHAATGATDNAVGSAVMMEAARILQTIGAQPRRTIRVALWSGEEQGLLGSQAYVAEHFGSFEDPKPGFEKLAAYLNIDHGTGRVRGAHVFGPPAGAAILRALLEPFGDLGAYGAVATSSRAVGGTDHASFNRAGLPGINFVQDPIEYSSHTHHTNLDTYERIIEEDAKASAIIVASVVYHLAMRDEPLPRFTAADMPPPRGR